VQEALTRASGYLRSEVAGTISRKRAPQLVFRVVTEDSQ
jgi:ribosome-binding factor A